MARKCPSCGSVIGGDCAVCPSCAWQFSQTAAHQSMRSAGEQAGGNSIVRGVVRPPHLSARKCQLAVLVVDKSRSMEGQKARDAANACQDLVGELAQPANRDAFFVGVVTFDNAARIAHPATPATALTKRLGRLTPGWFAGSTNITDGLAKARTVIAGLVPPSGVVPQRPVTILFSDGGHNEGPSPDGESSDLRQYTDLVTVAFGADADMNLLCRLATSPQHFYRCADGSQLRRLFADIGVTMTATMARGANMTAALAGLR